MTSMTQEITAQTAPSTQETAAAKPAAGKFNVPRNKVPERSVAERVVDFREVLVGFTAEMAQSEANRCIFCAKNPKCEVMGCPLHNRIRDWMKLTSQGKFLEAAIISQSTSNMPEICGRVCPQEKLCEGVCIVGIKGDPVAIGSVERFLADYLHDYLAKGGEIPEELELLMPAKGAPTGKKVAVVGGGPAGIACAEQLLKLGHAVTILDRWPRLGGLLRYGIPTFKLQHDVVNRKEERLVRLGLEFRGNVEVGANPSIPGLLEEGFDAVFIGAGAPIDSNLRVEGSDMKGVYKATNFLVRGNVPKEDLPEIWRDPIDVKGQNVVVLGGGDTAMDCLRTALRQGANKVSCVYRRDEANMPGAKKEKKMATEEGVDWIWLAAPLKFLGENGQVTGVECQRMQLGEPDASGRRSPVAIEGETFVVPATTVVLALGYNNEGTIPTNTPGMKHNKWFQIEVDPATGATSVPGVFAGGDVVSGADLVVTAVVAGRKAAEAIHSYVMGEVPEAPAQA